MLPYEEPQYAGTRLRESIVRFKGEPVFVLQVGAKGGKVAFQTLARAEDHELAGIGECTLQDLDINPVPLGYVNEAKFAYYVSRCPVREDWRQGLRKNTMRTIPGGINVNFKFLRQTILGKYPNLKDALKLVNDRERESVAFSRSFAISRGGILHHKGQWQVGEIDERGYTLLPKFQWVEEALNEELNAA